MNTTQWIITLAVTLIAGGAMGSLISILATNLRNRVQRIIYQTETIPFVNEHIKGAGEQAEVLIKLKGEEKSFSNLTLGRVKIKNTSNRDFEEFKFGVTLSGLSMAVYLRAESQDRYHQITSDPQIDLEHLDDEIDFTLKPFNRKDVYSVVLFILPIGDDPVEIKLVTNHPVKLVEASEDKDRYYMTRNVVLAAVLAGPIVGIVIGFIGRRSFTIVETVALLSIMVTMVGAFLAFFAIPTRRQ
jgi:hypothetical protein